MAQRKYMYLLKRRYDSKVPYGYRKGETVWSTESHLPGWTCVYKLKIN